MVYPQYPALPPRGPSKNPGVRARGVPQDKESGFVRPVAKAPPTPLTIPPPEQLGVANPASPTSPTSPQESERRDVKMQGTDWGAIREQLRELGITGFSISASPGGILFRLELPHTPSNSRQTPLIIVGSGATEDEAVRDGLLQARRQLALTR